MPANSMYPLAISWDCAGVFSQLGPPLIIMTFEIYRFAAGMVASTDAAIPPADWPPTVMLEGSPPKEDMFSYTHVSAATISESPQLGWKRSPRKEKSIKPSTPKR